MNSAPGQVILKGISSVKDGYPPLFADTPLQTSSSPPRITSSSPAVMSPVRLAELLQPAPHVATSARTKWWIKKKKKKLLHSPRKSGLTDAETELQMSIRHQIQEVHCFPATSSSACALRAEITAAPPDGHMRYWTRVWKKKIHLKLNF